VNLVIQQQGIQKRYKIGHVETTTVGLIDRLWFAGASRGRSGEISGEASRWSGTGGSWNTYTNHCTQDFHAV